MTAELHALLETFAVFVEDAVGLSFPLERRDDLHRAALQLAMHEGYAGAEDCMQAIMQGEVNADLTAKLARYLSTGETYFFRDAATFSILKSEILPQLIAARLDSGRKTLRILSAGCCSGEEAYSLSILAHSLLDGKGWDLRIAGVDLNPDFVQSARAGLYGEWSFRGVSEALKLRHFTIERDGKYAVSAEGRSGVDFRLMNLAADDYGVLDDLAPFDLVICQNVLMYFGAGPWSRVAARMHDLLSEDGWFFVSPVESDRSLYPQYRPVEMGGLTFYSKGTARVHGASVPYGT